MVVVAGCTENMTLVFAALRLFCTKRSSTGNQVGFSASFSCRFREHPARAQVKKNETRAAKRQDDYVANRAGKTRAECAAFMYATKGRGNGRTLLASRDAYLMIASGGPPLGFYNKPRRLAGIVWMTDGGDGDCVLLAGRVRAKPWGTVWAGGAFVCLRCANDSNINMQP
jgi:hypothetical protein